MKNELSNTNNKHDNNKQDEYLIELENRNKELTSHNEELSLCYDELKINLESLLESYKELKSKSDNSLYNQDKILQLSKDLNSANEKINI